MGRSAASATIRASRRPSDPISWGIRETQPQRQLTLIARFLDRQSVNLLETGVQQIAEAVPKTASFRRASTGSWDLIPTHRHVFARNTGGGIDEEDPAFITYRSQV